MSGTGQEDENSMEYWRTKCIKLEKVIKTLSNHCIRVVEHHEDLLKKFKKNQNQYNQLKTKCHERGEQIKKARDVLIPVSNELKTLREKYETAIRCQMEAESFAIETTSENKKLHRQSQMLMNTLGSVNICDIDIDSLDTDVEVDKNEKDYIEKLRNKIYDLEGEKTSLDIQVVELNESLQDEKEDNKRLQEKIDLLKEDLRQMKMTVKQQEELLEKVAVTSEKVYTEFNNMEETYRKEVAIRSEVEIVAKKLHSERDQARRESAMALSKVADNKKLMDAMLQIQDLNANLAENKANYERKISELESQLITAQEIYSEDSVQSENDELNNEVKTLQDQLQERQTELNTLVTKYSDLRKLYEELENKLEEATKPRIPAPPPPPPPPSSHKIGGFLQKIVGKKGQREKAKEKLMKGGVALDSNHSKAVEEMMKRIKSGNVGLRPVLQRRAQSLPDKEEPSAMTELQGLLSKMRKSRSEDDLSVFGDNGVDEDSELGMVFRRRQQLQQDKESTPIATDVVTSRPVPLPRKLSTIADEQED